MNFVWDRVCIDEAHQEQKFNNEAVLIFKKIDFHVRNDFWRKLFSKAFSIKWLREYKFYNLAEIVIWYHRRTRDRVSSNIDSVKWLHIW
jgi:hypothetical protein